MKNKKLTYILIPLVLLIWGLIFYKIYSNINHDRVVAPSSSVYRNTSKDTIRDTFILKANYRDPFLSGNHPVVSRSMSMDGFTGNSYGFSKKPDPRPEMIIPDLKYFGLIANAKKKQKVGLFRLNNKDLILKETDVYEDFKVISLYNDSVKTTYKKIKKTFKKNTNPS